MRPGARAQQAPRRIARVAILSPGASEARSVLTAFRTRLCELGYVEGRDVALEFHFANGSERLAALAQAIVRDGPDLVLADGRLAAQAMRAASRTIPIVAITGEPVTFGLAESLARPGGNVTGIATMSAELGAKQLELLREILPRARRIGVVDASMSAVSYRAFEGRAARPSAMSSGIVVPPSAPVVGLSATLVRLTNASGKPAIYGDRDFVAAGGLVFYGTSSTMLSGAARASPTACSRAPARRRRRSNSRRASRSSSTSRPRRRCGSRSRNRCCCVRTS